MFQGFFEFPYFRIHVLKINKNTIFHVKILTCNWLNNNNSKRKLQNQIHNKIINKTDQVNLFIVTKNLMQFFSGSFTACQKIYYKSLKDTIITFLSDTVQKREEIKFAKLGAFCVFRALGAFGSSFPLRLTHLHALPALIFTRLNYMPCLHGFKCHKISYSKQF